MSHTYEHSYDNNEPPYKKFKSNHEPQYVKFSRAYLTVEGYLILLNNIETDKYYRQYTPVLHFQTVEGADIYIISDICTDLIDINKTYTLDQIHNYFINGKFNIGSKKHNDAYYRNGIIKNINNLYHDDNSEIKLHYSTTRLNSSNVAWRTITWDLFEIYVPQIVLQKLII